MTWLFLTVTLAHYTHAPDGTLLPDPKVTTGPVREDATREQLCAHGFTTKKYRHTSHETKCQAYANYGLLGPGCKQPVGVHEPLPKAVGPFEVDHLCPLTLGGQDVIENLWPQAGPAYHVKDKLEVLLHRLVCKGEIELADAQACIRVNWETCWRKWGPK